MVWKALALWVVALSIYAPVAGENRCSESPCCARMQACCGHCNCAPKQTCAVSKSATIDPQTVARAPQLSPRVDLELFAVGPSHRQALEFERPTLSRLPESPPLDTSQSRQSLLCLWLI